MSLVFRFVLVVGLCALSPAPLSAAGAGGKTVRLATTTSTVSSGLLDVLEPLFRSDSGYRLEIFAVGSGRALRLGRLGEVDVLLVHSPQAEEAFVRDGHDTMRRSVMSNEFVIVGPASDPAAISQAVDIAAALDQISSNGAGFVSRADDSGTHVKERSLWQHAGIEPRGSWYYESGLGMAGTLKRASEQGAYTLADRGSWLAQHSSLSLKLLFSGEAPLDNPYSVIGVNPNEHPGVNQLGAQAFVDWITSPRGQQAIREFRIDGQPVFTAAVEGHSVAESPAP